MPFKDINFGMAAAETEKTQYPNLLIEGFLDAYGYIDSILISNKYLVLGPKGSGKTAIASKLELIAKDKQDLFIKSYYLYSDFPHTMFSQLMESDEAPITKYQNYWEFLILMSFLESFSIDSSAMYEDNKLYKNLIKAMQDVGLIPCQTLTDMVKTAKGDRFKLNILKFINIEKYSESQKISHGLDIIFGSLRKVCYSISSKGNHILIIDGLDDILNQQDKQYETISSLIVAADRINRKFKGNNVKAKTVILCRTDLFERLPGPNNNKIKQDYAINLDWYQDVRDPYSTNLVRLINLRAETSLRRKINIFIEFLPISLKRHDITVKTLLDNTRYRPRDFIQLLNFIQRSTKYDKPTQDEIWNGIRSYSLDYLMDEIKNELDGYLTSEEKDQSLKLLGVMNKSKFSLSELVEKKKNDNRFKSLDLMKALNALFDCGAISNYRKDPQRDKDINTTKYRNPHVCFDPTEDIKIHWGLVKALNF